MAKLVDFQGRWAAEIGRAFIAFGSIEHVTVVWLRTIPKDRIERSTQGLKLAPRIDLIVELLEAREGEVFAKLRGKLLRAKELAVTRNLIAHNPLVLEFYERADGTMFHKEVIAAMHKDRVVQFDELVQFATDAETLSSDLYGAASAVFAAIGSKEGENVRESANDT